MEPELIVAYITVPDRTTATDIAQTLVEQGLAACVNLVGPLQSVYIWQGTLNTDGELLLVVKTRLEHLPAVQNVLAALHPYEVPELIALPIIAGSPGYLQWLKTATSTTSPNQENDHAI
jgi:periplasmic divalent cation tolerance protein